MKYRFENNFKGLGIFEGCVVEKRHMQKRIKIRDVLYTDGDSEDLSLVQIRPYKRLTPKFLSHVKV